MIFFLSSYCRYKNFVYLCNRNRERQQRKNEIMVRQFSWLEYMPVTHGVTGSSPVRTAKANRKLKQSSEIQGFQSFFCFLYRQRITIKNKSCVGLFVGFLPVLLYSSDELELSCGIIGNSGTNIRKSYTPSLVLSRYLCHQKFSKKNRVI